MVVKHPEKKIKAGYFLQGAESEGTCLDITL